MFLKLKVGFKRFGGIFAGNFKGQITNGQDPEKHNHNNREATSVTMPETKKLES